MFSHRLYFRLKPFLPWRLRMALRRVTARRKLRSCAHRWPISEAAGARPAGWPGWPEGKDFSVVLTHDVEGHAGLRRCRQLAELERSLGFRSSFNFIPEGGYRVPDELRSWLAAEGFEVGVHDLRHDGHLFASQNEFKASAQKINRYLRDWDAHGFRSGFMLRNLDWFHSLQIAYDCSTFDTDPFEIQSDGAGTIFPFWVPRSSALNGSAAPGAGYVELPYTLAQDSTLFLVLGESSPSIWLRKLDWVASRGGMALVNVHPDYLHFAGEKTSDRSVSADHYRTLLEYIRDRHAGRYWAALPREVAAFYVRSVVSKPNN